MVSSSFMSFSAEGKSTLGLWKGNIPATSSHEPGQCKKAASTIAYTSGICVLVLSLSVGWCSDLL